MSPEEFADANYWASNDAAFEQRWRDREAANITPHPLKLFYHVACIGNWQEVVEEQVAVFSQVGLELDAFALGSPADVAWVRRRVNVVASNPDVRLYETPTLDLAYQWACQHRDGAVLYVHTKGVSAADDPIKPAWRRLMMGYVVRDWQVNLERLSRQDIVGVDWQDSPRFPHFSGNFWMARADWIAHLPSPWTHRDLYDIEIIGHPWARMHAEMWIGSRPHHRMESLCCRNETLWEGPRAIELLELSPYAHLDR